MIRQYRKLWLKRRAKYENKARIIFQRSFKKLLLEVLQTNLTNSTYALSLEFYITEEKITNIYKEVYTYIGLLHGKRVGKEINAQIKQKDFVLNDFISVFERNILSWLVDNGAERIVSVRRSYIDYIKELIARGINDGKTISEIATELQELVKSRKFYRWQSLRIARTETTTASNYASSLAGETSGFLMDKIWISALDRRTRRRPEDDFDHYEMNNERIPLENNFIVSGEEMAYPGDPKASVGNIINCRCTIAQRVRRDENGELMRV